MGELPRSKPPGCGSSDVAGERDRLGGMSLAAAIVLGAVIGFALGVLISMTTDVPPCTRGRPRARRAGRLAFAPGPPLGGSSETTSESRPRSRGGVD
jgi:hypothetical protein